MKKMKKLVSLLLAVVMVIAMTVTGFAATVENATDHPYKAYQVFTGTQAADDEKGILGDIVWGNGITEAGQTALQTTYEVTSAAELAAKITDESAAKVFAKAIVAGNYLAENAIEINENAQSVEVESGYYLLVDSSEFEMDDVNTWYNLALLQVTGNGNIEIAEKNDIPSVVKKVEENSSKYNQDGGYGAGYNDVADYNIGDSVSFELIGTLPTKLAEYDTYEYTFHDTLSAGLTYVEGSVAVKKNGTDVVNADDYTINYENNKLTISFTDIKKVTTNVNDKIYVYYEAILNKNAVIGLDGNVNEVYLEYSNNPNGENTGKTATDKVIVFTYKLEVTKVDGTDKQKKLADAEFILQNSEGKYYQKNENADVTTISWVDKKDVATVLTSDENGVFAVTGLDDGTYTLTEIKAPSGYNILTTPINLTVAATTTNGQTWNDFVAANALTNISITSGDKTVDGNVNAGSVSLTVENNQGGVLPETGGIGTTILYVVGTILVLGAAILLITKKRMNVEK